MMRFMFCLFCSKLNKSTSTISDDSVYCRYCGQKCCVYHLLEMDSGYDYEEIMKNQTSWICINCQTTPVLNSKVLYNPVSGLCFNDGINYFSKVAEQQRYQRAKAIFKAEPNSYSYLPQNDFQPLTWEQQHKYENQLNNNQIAQCLPSLNGNSINIFNNVNDISAGICIVSTLYLYCIYIVFVLYLEHDFDEFEEDEFEEDELDEDELDEDELDEDELDEDELYEDELAQHNDNSQQKKIAKMLDNIGGYLSNNMETDNFQTNTNTNTNTNTTNNDNYPYTMTNPYSMTYDQPDKSPFDEDRFTFNLH